MRIRSISPFCYTETTLLRMPISYSSPYPRQERIYFKPPKAIRGDTGVHHLSDVSPMFLLPVQRLQ